MAEANSGLSKQGVLDRMTSASAEMRTELDRLSAEEIAAPGPDGGWSVRDHLAHLAAWQDSISSLIRGGTRWAGLGVDRATYEEQSEDEVNEAIRRQHAGEDVAGTREYLEAAEGRMREAVGGLSDADLSRPSGSFSAEGGGGDGAIVESIAGNTWEHYREHLGWMRELVAGRA